MRGTHAERDRSRKPPEARRASKQHCAEENVDTQSRSGYRRLETRRAGDAGPPLAQESCLAERADLGGDVAELIEHELAARLERVDLTLHLKR